MESIFLINLVTYDLFLSLEMLIFLLLLKEIFILIKIINV